MSGDDVSHADSAADGESTLAGRADFERALALTESLAQAGTLQWRLSGAARITPRLDEDAVVREIGPKDTKERGAFERILSGEILPALNRAAKSPPAGFDVPRDLSPSDRAEQKKRNKEVRKRLYTKALEQRVLIRKTCKGSVLDGVRWDISIKKHDLGTGTVPDLPYGTIEMSFAASVDEGPLSFLGIAAQRQVVSFDCHLHDLEALLTDLHDLKSNLEKLTTDRGEK